MRSDLTDRRHLRRQDLPLNGKREREGGGEREKGRERQTDRQRVRDREAESVSECM